LKKEKLKKLLSEKILNPYWPNVPKPGLKKKSKKDRVETETFNPRPFIKPF